MRRKIVICGSLGALAEMREAAEVLQRLGFRIALPLEAQERTEDRIVSGRQSEDPGRKQKDNVLRDYFREIAGGDAVLIVNPEQYYIPNYIGSSVFLGMGFAHVLKKKIFILNEIPEMPYCEDEIRDMEPTVLGGDLQTILIYFD